MFLRLGPKVNKAAVGKEKLTAIFKEELEPTKRNLGQSLTDSSFDHGVTCRRSWTLYHGAHPLAQESKKLRGGDPEVAEGSVGLTVVQQWQGEPAGEQQQTQDAAAPGSLHQAFQV